VKRSIFLVVLGAGAFSASLRAQTPLPRARTAERSTIPVDRSIAKVVKPPLSDSVVRAAAEARPDVVVLPKVESPEDVSAAAEVLPDGIGLEAQIETARGLAEAERIAAAGAGLEALVFGPADLAASLGVPVLTIGAGPTDYARAHVVAAARASNLQALDGPHARLGDDLPVDSHFHLFSFGAPRRPACNFLSPGW